MFSNCDKADCFRAGTRHGPCKWMHVLCKPMAANHQAFVAQACITARKNSLAPWHWYKGASWYW